MEEIIGSVTPTLELIQSWSTEVLLKIGVRGASHCWQIWMCLHGAQQAWPPVSTGRRMMVSTAGKALRNCEALWCNLLSYKLTLCRQPWQIGILLLWLCVYSFYLLALQAVERSYCINLLSFMTNQNHLCTLRNRVQGRVRHDEWSLVNRNSFDISFIAAEWISLDPIFDILLVLGTLLRHSRTSEKMATMSQTEFSNVFSW